MGSALEPPPGAPPPAGVGEDLAGKAEGLQSGSEVRNLCAFCASLRGDVEVPGAQVGGLATHGDAVWEAQIMRE